MCLCCYAAVGSSHSCTSFPLVDRTQKRKMHIHTSSVLPWSQFACRASTSVHSSAQLLLLSLLACIWDTWQLFPCDQLVPMSQDNSIQCLCVLAAWFVTRKQGIRVSYMSEFVQSSIVSIILDSNRWAKPRSGDSRLNNCKQVRIYC